MDWTLRINIQARNSLKIRTGRLSKRSVGGRGQVPASHPRWAFVCPDSLNNTLVGSPSLLLSAGPDRWHKGGDVVQAQSRLWGQGPGSRLWSLIVLGAAFLAGSPTHCSVSGSVGDCLSGRRPQAAFALLIGALTETHFLLMPDRTSKQALLSGCPHPQLMVTQWHLKSNWRRQAQSTWSHPGAEAKTLLSEK